MALIGHLDKRTAAAVSLSPTVLRGPLHLLQEGPVEGIVVLLPHLLHYHLRKVHVDDPTLPAVPEHLLPELIVAGTHDQDAGRPLVNGVVAETSSTLAVVVDDASLPGRGSIGRRR